MRVHRFYFGEINLFSVNNYYILEYQRLLLKLDLNLKFNQGFIDTILLTRHIFWYSSISVLMLILIRHEASCLEIWFKELPHVCLGVHWLATLVSPG